MTILSFILVGFLLGLRHATDADHVIAMSTLVSRERSLRPALMLGALWGIGHTLTLTVAGTLLLAFGVVIPARAALLLEGVVGMMLVALGVWALSGAYQALRRMPGASTCGRERGAQTHADTAETNAGFRQTQREATLAYRHRHPHAHGDYVHTHGHGHGHIAHGHALDRTPVRWLDKRAAGSAWYVRLRPMAIGIVHGLAGSASVALLVMTGTREIASGLLYFFAFGIGTLAGMALLSAAMVWPLLLAAQRLPNFAQGVRAAAGVVSVAFGLAMLVQLSTASDQSVAREGADARRPLYSAH